MNKKIAFALLVVVFVQLACRNNTLPVSISTPPTPAAVTEAPVTTSVPAIYQDLYDHLDTMLDEDIRLLDVAESSVHYPTTFAAELIVADDNRGTALLDPQTMEATSLYLDRLQELGIGGVKIAVQYPFFTPSFPNYPQYLDFYREVAQEIHQRGMTLTVQASILFANTPFTEFNYDFSGLTFEQYKEDDRAMIDTIIHELQPEYIVVISEPDTAAKLTGLREFNDPGKGVELVNFILEDLDRGSTKICAGTGTWTSPDYSRQLAAQTQIDCVSIHIYPVHAQFIENALAMAEDAKANQKGVIVSEAWLYKTDHPTGGNNVATSSDIFKLDAFSFWAPLDQKFLQMMAEFADKAEVDFMSVFWSPFLFRYVDYEPGMEDMSYPSLRQESNQIIFNAILDHSYSSTGLYYRDLIKQRK